MFFVRPTRIFFPDPGGEKLCAFAPSRGHTAPDFFYPTSKRYFFPDIPSDSFQTLLIADEVALLPA
jgi:hypothetical protein